MNTLRKVSIALVTGVLFYLSIWYMFKNQNIAIIATISVALHELGHAAALWMYGHRKISLFFVPFLGAAVSMDHEKVKDMPRLQQAIVALAGPAVNVLIIVLSFFFLHDDSLGTDALASMSINASLAIFNLLPFGFIDGGRFAKALFYSTDEQTDRLISVFVSVLALVIGFTLLILNGKFNLFYILIYFGIRRESELDDPEGHLSESAMTLTQSKILLGLYLFMLISTWLLNYYLPSWTSLY